MIRNYIKVHGSSFYIIKKISKEDRQWSKKWFISIPYKVKKEKNQSSRKIIKYKNWHTVNWTVGIPKWNACFLFVKSDLFGFFEMTWSGVFQCSRWEPISRLCQGEKILSPRDNSSVFRRFLKGKHGVHSLGRVLVLLIWSLGLMLLSLDCLGSFFWV